ncbi:MAG: hypothetical protein ACFFAS_01715 [Promethearchaeota archaeon]
MIDLNIPSPSQKRCGGTSIWLKPPPEMNSKIKRVFSCDVMMSHSEPV